MKIIDDVPGRYAPINYLCIIIAFYRCAVPFACSPICVRAFGPRTALGARVRRGGGSSNAAAGYLRDARGRVIIGARGTAGRRVQFSVARRRAVGARRAEISL